MWEGPSGPDLKSRGLETAPTIISRLKPLAQPIQRPVGVRFSRAPTKGQKNDSGFPVAPGGRSYKYSRRTRFPIPVRTS